MIRWHVIKAVFKRNVMSYFSGLLGYLFIIVFVVASSSCAFEDEFFTDNTPSLDHLTAVFPWMLLFIVPAITMTVWAEERRSGTDELLFTLPGTDTEIMIGKYLSVIATYSIALVFSMTQLGVLRMLSTQTDWGIVFTTYLGYWFAGCSLLSAGMLASSLSRSTPVAFVLGSVFCVFPVLLGNVSNDTLRNLSVAENLRDFSIGLISFSSVMYFVSFAAIMLYLNYIVIAHRHWSARKGELMGGNFVARTLCVVATFASLTYFTSYAFQPGDFSEEKLYTLSTTTRDLVENPIEIKAFISSDLPSDYAEAKQKLIAQLTELKNEAVGHVTLELISLSSSDKEKVKAAKALKIQPFEIPQEGDAEPLSLYFGVSIASPFSSNRFTPLDKELSQAEAITKAFKTLDDNPIEIQAFISKEVPREYIETRKTLISLLDRIEKLGGNRITVRRVEIAPYDDRADEAETLGIRPVILQEDNAGRVERIDVFLGAMIKSSTDQVVIPFFGKGLPIEYELARAIGTVSRANRLKVGILMTDARLVQEEVSNRNQEWQITRMLRMHYDVVPVDPSKAIDPGEFDVLLAVMPSSLAPEQMPNLVDYVRTGAPVLIFDDPVPITMSQPHRSGRPMLVVAPRVPKPAPGGMMAMMSGNQQPPPPKADGGKLTSLLDVLQIAWQYDQIVWDEFNPHLELEDLGGEYLFISPQSGFSSAISNESPITSGMQELLAFHSGTIQMRENMSKNRTFTPLLRTSNDGVLVDWDTFTEPELDFQTFTQGFVVNPLQSTDLAEFFVELSYLDPYFVELSYDKQEKLLTLKLLDRNKKEHSPIDPEKLTVVVDDPSSKDGKRTLKLTPQSTGDDASEVASVFTFKAENVPEGEELLTGTIRVKLEESEFEGPMSEANIASLKEGKTIQVPIVEGDTPVEDKSLLFKIRDRDREKDFPIETADLSVIVDDPSAEALFFVEISYDANSQELIFTLLNRDKKNNYPVDGDALTVLVNDPASPGQKLPLTILAKPAEDDPKNRSSRFVVDYDDLPPGTNKVSGWVYAGFAGDSFSSPFSVADVTKLVKDQKTSLVMGAGKTELKLTARPTKDDPKDRSSRFVIEQSKIPGGTTALSGEAKVLSSGDWRRGRFSVPDVTKLAENRATVVAMAQRAPHVIAAQIKEKDKVNAIFVADLDMISNTFFGIREQGGIPGLKLHFDNISFAMNAIDILADDDTYVELRKRRPKLRTLTTLQKQRDIFINERNVHKQIATNEAQNQLKAARERFEEQETKIKEDTSLDDRSKAMLIENLNRAEARRLEVAEANIRREESNKINKIDRDMKREIGQIEHEAWLKAVLLSPLPACVLGILMMIQILISEKRSVVPERSVK